MGWPVGGKGNASDNSKGKGKGAQQPKGKGKGKAEHYSSPGYAYWHPSYDPNWQQQQAKWGPTPQEASPTYSQALALEKSVNRITIIVVEQS